MTHPGGERPCRWPAAFLITFSCYGARTHGEDRATVDKQHNGFGAPFADEHPGRVYIERRCMVETAFLLDEAARDAVLAAVRQVSEFRGWKLRAAHVRKTHVHIVVRAETEPSNLLRDFKTYSSRAVNGLASQTVRKKRWSRHGSTRWLWTEKAVLSAVEYVLYGQGSPLAVWSQHPELRTQPAR